MEYLIEKMTRSCRCDIVCDTAPDVRRPKYYYLTLIPVV